MAKRDYITSATRIGKAPDRRGVRDLGSVECHYAVKGNLNPTHVRQEDRASVFALPQVQPEEFQGIIQNTFDLMKTTHQGLVKKHSDFSGDSCTTITMFDPKTGMVAIGSKGDAATYLVMHNKHDARDAIVKRISTHHENAIDNEWDGPLFTSRDHPVMWANKHSWAMKKTPFMATDEKQTRPVDFELINLKETANAMLYMHNGQKPGDLNDYTLTLVMGSDGLTGRSLDVQPTRPVRDKESDDEWAKKLSDWHRKLRQPTEERFREIARAMEPSSKTNYAEAILEAVASHAKHPQYRTYDNCSAIVLAHVTRGEGDAIAACICDGNRDKTKGNPIDGSVAAQKTIDVFETVMHQVRDHAATRNVATPHQDRIKQRQTAQVSSGAVSP